MSARKGMPLGLPTFVAAKVVPDLKTGCWPWTGRRSKGGYGRCRYRRKMWSVHRLVYTLLVGPIPEGLTIDHVRARGCASTACCNPAHLEPVTLRENLLRGDTFQARNAAQTHCPHGHAYSGENLYVNPSGWRLCRTCARERRKR